MIFILRRYVKFGISACYWLVCKIYKALRRMAGYPEPGRCVILYYHSIREHGRAMFARQMAELLRRAELVNVDASIEMKPGTLYAAVTFDDGFQCILDYALPELAARNIPCTVFVTTGFMGQSPGWEHETKFDDLHEPVLTAEQVRALPSDLVTIGSHTVNHFNLCRVDEATVLRELEQSRLQLEQLVGQSVDLLSFPYGAHNEPVLRAAQTAGYRRVFTNQPASALLSDSAFKVGRVPVCPCDTMLEFRLKIIGAYDWLSALLSLRARVSRMMRADSNGRD
jgi:peptidoglycan/xylan/chitin deacetylase (PgdA/CDA1 family)